MTTPRKFTCECAAPADILVVPMERAGLLTYQLALNTLGSFGFAACYAHSERAIRWVADNNPEQPMAVRVVTGQ